MPCPWADLLPSLLPDPVAEVPSFVLVQVRVLQRTYLPIHFHLLSFDHLL
jgi:hypothetical protein